MAIRVLRLIEYIYDDAERAEADQQRWHIPAIGTQRHGNMVIRSTILTDLAWEHPTSINFPPQPTGKHAEDPGPKPADLPGLQRIPPGTRVLPAETRQPGPEPDWPTQPPLSVGRWKRPEQ